MRLNAVVLAALSLLMLSSAYGAQRNDKDDQPKPTISAATGKVLNEAIGFLNMDDYKSALATIDKLKLDKLSPFEHSRVEQILFSISFQQGDYNKARGHLESAIKAGGFSPPEVSKAKFTIAKIYLLQENYKAGATALEDWFKTAVMPNSAAYYLLAVAYYQQGEMGKALTPAKKAVELGGDSPRPEWLQMLYALYVDKEDYKNAIPVVKRLVELEPKKKDHWLALSSMYQQVEDYNKALATLQIAYNAGLLDQGGEFKRVATLAVFNGIPARCARILETALKSKEVKAESSTYQTLSQCYVNAREFEESIPPLKKAAELSKNGDLYVRLGEVQIQEKNWDAVKQAAQDALDKGDLDDKQYPALLMGIALYNQKKPEEARKWFVRAEASKKHRDTARSYVRRIDFEAQQAAAQQGQ